ncbi:MAG: biotin-dependent carboxyltransferase family protein, partial [Bacteroidota bacterium]|nr:biotin-dependent carboxyltransferase family protein [Bacteroidota bacterium]
LVGNSNDEAVFEITMMGGRFAFHSETSIAICGAIFEITLNNKSIVNNNKIDVKKGDILNFGKALKGFRVYLAISGGFRVNSILNSSSFYENLTPNITVEKGDKFNFLKKNNLDFAALMDTESIFNSTIEVTPGPEFNLINNKDIQLLNEEYFIVSSNNRMGYFFENGLSPNNFSIITSPVIPGTIQLTPSGKMIALMKDGQVSGGYPRILQMNDLSISILSQKKQGDRIKFKIVELT